VGIGFWFRYLVLFLVSLPIEILFFHLIILLSSWLKKIIESLIQGELRFDLSDSLLILLRRLAAFHLRSLDKVACGVDVLCAFFSGGIVRPL
jgi:hypothetical protein